MELSAEDTLRLNVLLANDLHAIRIDESNMSVHGFSDRGESTVRLNPTGRDEPYLKRVRELLSSHVLGSPGGYPIYLRRWTRMGQARDDSLEKLLLLGEPEAVVAVVHAPGLNNELARRAWWAMPTADNARMMLARDCVCKGSMGPVLADYLIDYLPFEEEHQAMIDTVRLVLQPGLISAEKRQRIWSKARSKNTYYVGFLLTCPDDLPEPFAPHPALDELTERLGEQTADNTYAAFLLRLLGAAGQGFLATSEAVMRKPNNQDVMVALLEAIQSYFQPIAASQSDLQSIESIQAHVEHRCRTEPALQTLLSGDAERAPQLSLAPLVRAMLMLATVGEPLVAPVFARTDAIGSVMRNKLAHITSPLLEQIAILRGNR